MNKEEKQIVRVISIVLTAVLLFTTGAFTGMLTSSNNSINVNYSAQVNADTTVATTISATVPTTAVTTTMPSTTSPASENTMTTSQATTSAPAQSGEKSVGEIVEIYNTGINRVKSTATQITRNYKKLSSLEEYLQLPSAIEGLGKTAMNTFVKGSDEPQVWTSKEDFKIGFPVGNEDYSSHLTETMVQSATCKENGDKYEIEIILLDDAVTSPKKGEGYAGVFNTVTASTFEGINIPTVTFNSVEVNGICGKITCTVDKATGNVTEATFINTDVLKLDVKVAFSNLQAQMALASEENFTIVY